MERSPDDLEGIESDVTYNIIKDIVAEMTSLEDEADKRVLKAYLRNSEQISMITQSCGEQNESLALKLITSFQHQIDTIRLLHRSLGRSVDLNKVLLNRFVEAMEATGNK